MWHGLSRHFGEMTQVQFLALCCFVGCVVLPVASMSHGQVWIALVPRDSLWMLPRASLPFGLVASRFGVLESPMCSRLGLFWMGDHASGFE